MMQGHTPTCNTVEPARKQCVYFEEEEEEEEEKKKYIFCSSPDVIPPVH